MVTRQTQRNLRAFTLIELLVVIAIIAILAAILFPVFAVVREQAHQSNTMSSLHNVYVGAKMFDDDEGHFPYTLFPWAETTVNPVPLTPPYNRPMISDSDLPVVPMNLANGYFTTDDAERARARISVSGAEQRRHYVYQYRQFRKKTDRCYHGLLAAQLADFNRSGRNGS